MQKYWLTDKLHLKTKPRGKEVYPISRLNRNKTVCICLEIF